MACRHMDFLAYVNDCPIIQSIVHTQGHWIEFPSKNHLCRTMRRWGVFLLIVLLVLMALIFCGWVWQNNIRLPIF
jgi:hypothetical protein